MSRSEGVRSKAVVTAQAYGLAGWPVEGLGPGSKEKKSALNALGAAIGLDLVAVPSKIECGRRVASLVDVAWDRSCFSAGDTITLVGMSRLVDGVALKTGEDQAASGEDTVAGVVSGTMEDLSMSMSTKSELEQSLAERLAELSGYSDVPEGVSPPAREIKVDAIDFVDGSWREHVTNVQGWLHLVDDLDSSGGAAFDASLAVELGLLESGRADGAHPGRDALLASLARRLDRAVVIRGKFLEDMESADEGSVTLESASQSWVAAWEEAEGEDEAEIGGPIQATADIWSIVEFVAFAEDGQMELSPSYQRADVWPTRDAQLLIESVLRGIPLPSVILMEKMDEENGTRYEVVDGKQRLTSILRFIGKHPHAIEIVAEKEKDWGEVGLLDTFTRDYSQFKRLWKKHEHEPLSASREREYHFPFALRSGDVPSMGGDLSAFKGKYYCQIKDQTIKVIKQSRKLSSIFERQSDYRLPVIVYKQVTPAQIHEVFSLYNKQGKHLNAEEIRNALYHELHLMRGLLVAAGDAEDVASVAPFLVDDWADLSSTPKTLDSYGFGRVGYKRTKVLSWVAATLFAEPGGLGGRSTAGTVNALLKRVQDNRTDPLRQDSVVREAMLLLDHGLDAHAAVSPEVWSSTFRTGRAGGRKGATGGWQELPLVSVLVALGAAQSVLGDGLDDRLEEVAEEVQQASGRWVRPLKTQTSHQWRYTAGVVRELLSLLRVTPGEVDEAMQQRFGQSGIGGLVRLVPLDEWKS